VRAGAVLVIRSLGRGDLNGILLTGDPLMGARRARSTAFALHEFLLHGEAMPPNVEVYWNRNAE
jgi:hypothetical protein